MLIGYATGYATFFANTSTYELNGSPRSWALVPGTRHAMATYPHSTFFFYLSPHAIIMDTKVDLKEHVLSKKKLESLMLRDKPVVPPDSVIKTFAHLKGDKIDLIVTQDHEGLCQGSFIVRQGEWAKFFLDTWFDPLYRSYNFQKAEGHALVGALHYFCTMNLLTIVTGAYCAMAPHHPHKTRSRTPPNPKHLQRRHLHPRRKRNHVQERRFSCPPSGVRTRSQQRLREGV